MRKIGIYLIMLFLITGKSFGEDIEFLSDDPYYKGTEYAMRGRFEEAKMEFEKALSVDPSNIPCRQSLEIIKDVINGKIKRNTAVSIFIGMGVCEVGGFEGGIVEFTKAINNDPDYLITYLLRGTVYITVGRYDQALADLNKVLEIDSKNSAVYVTRGVVYKRKKLYMKAISDYDKAIEINPNFADAYYNKGLAYEEMGSVKEAIEAFKEFLQSAPPKHYGFEITDAKGRIAKLEKQIKF